MGRGSVYQIHGRLKAFTQKFVRNVWFIFKELVLWLEYAHASSPLYHFFEEYLCMSSHGWCLLNKKWFTFNFEELISIVRFDAFSGSVKLSLDKKKEVFYDRQYFQFWIAYKRSKQIETSRMVRKYLAP